MSREPLHAAACGCRAYCRETGTLIACSHPTSALCKLTDEVANSKFSEGGVAESTAVWSGAGAEGQELMSARSSASCPSKPESRVVNCVHSSISCYLSVATVACAVSSLLCRRVTLVCEACSSCVRRVTRLGGRGAGFRVVGMSS